MPEYSIHAQPPLEFVPPDLKPGLARTLGALSPLLLKYKSSVTEIETRNVERLAELYREFQEGKARFLIAFRHPGTTDPLSIAYLLGQAVPKIARERGIPLRSLTHTYYLYDRGVPLWAGPLVGWLLPRLGGISLQRGKLDRQGLRTAREMFANGDQPMTVAPEGGTNGLNELVSPLEPGTAQMAFWCLDDLRAKGRDQKVYLLPLGIRYSYLQPPWDALDRLLATLEKECRLAPAAEADRYARLMRIGEYLMGLLEDYYARFYQQEFPSPAPELSKRLGNLLEAALRTSEQFFAIQPKGSPVDRCRRIEQAGWDRIYREDLKEVALSAVQRGLADRVAEEADRRMWHMRLVESFVAVTGSYVRENPTADRFAETAGLLEKTVRRLQGDMHYTPTSLGRMRVALSVGEPIPVDDLYPAYSANRQGARQAVADLTRTLQQEMTRLVQSDTPTPVL